MCCYSMMIIKCHLSTKGRILSLIIIPWRLSTQASISSWMYPYSVVRCGGAVWSGDFVEKVPRRRIWRCQAFLCCKGKHGYSRILSTTSGYSSIPWPIYLSSPFCLSFVILTILPSSCLTYSPIFIPFLPPSGVFFVCAPFCLHRISPLPHHFVCYSSFWLLIYVWGNRSCLSLCV